MMNSELPPNELPPSERPEPRRPTGGLPSSVLFGAILILLGGYFLLQMMGLLPAFEFNWWALFILFPALSLGSDAWRRYQALGEQADREVRNKAVIAGLLTLLALSMMFDVSWRNLWPVLLIIAGIFVLFGVIGPNRS